MKSSLIIVLCLLLLLTAASKPTDQECIYQVRSQVTDHTFGGQLLTDLAVNRHTLRVEDHIFYKKIYTLDGGIVGTGIFGRVILNK